MTRRVRQLRATTGYSTRQLAHLESGHDWAFIRGGGWGDLTDLPDDELSDTLRDMLACWRQHQPFPSSAALGMNPSDAPPWFQQYASEDGIERLYREVVGGPMREQYLRWAAAKQRPVSEDEP